MPTNFEIGKSITEANLPFFDGTMMIWAGVFIVLSIILSVMTGRSQNGFTQRALMYWVVNAIAFCLGIFFFTKTFPRIPSGWVLAALFILLFAISGMTVATKSKSGATGDKKEGEKDKK